MKLTKNQMVLIGIGGITAVAAGVLGFLIFGASAERTEALEELDVATSSVQRLYRSPISPEEKSVKILEGNRKAVAEWRDTALVIAGEGDRAIAKDVNEAAFKQMLVDEARELSKLPGDKGQPIVKPDFTFGFKNYIAGGELPDRAQLPKLQRQWSDIRFLVETLSACGVTEIVDITPSAAPAVVADADPPKGAKKGKPKKNGKAETAPVFVRETYSIDFRARPEALVKVANALATQSRFSTVDAFTFAREEDQLAAALAGDKTAAGAASSTGRRRRRRVDAEESAPAGEAAPENVRTGVATDPVVQAPFAVRLNLSTYDFGTKSAEAPAAAGAESSEEDKEEEE